MASIQINSNILNSALWGDRDARNVFITALLMAEPKKIKKETEAELMVSGEPKGFMISPGWYGAINASFAGIARRACMETCPVVEAMQRLAGEYEEYDEIAEYDGIQMVRLGDEFIVLHFKDYRKQDRTCAERSRKYRNRKKQVAEIIERDGEVCGICGEPVDLGDAHVDHIVPLFVGGTDDLENKQLAHPECNCGKGCGHPRYCLRHPSMPEIKHT